MSHPHSYPRGTCSRHCKPGVTQAVADSNLNHNSYKNGAALRQGWGALVPVATLTKEIARGGGKRSHSGVYQNTSTVLKSPPLTNPSDTKCDIGGGVKTIILGETHLPPGRPTPRTQGGAESNSLLGSAISPWLGRGNSEQCPFTTSAAQPLEEVI